jgi:hypothetical protein
MVSSRPNAVPEFSGEKSKLKRLEAIGSIDRRLHPEAGAFGHHLQAGPQLGAGLLDFVAQFTARESGEGGVGQLLPGHPLRLLQRLYGTIQGIRLSHAMARSWNWPELAIAMLKDSLTRDIRPEVATDIVGLRRSEEGALVGSLPTAWCGHGAT